MKQVLYVALISAFILVGCKDKVEEPEFEGDFESQQDTIEGERFGDGAMSQEEVEDKAVHAEVDEFEVELINEDGVGVGVATLTEKGGEVVIEVDAHHLQPGVHGFHIHEKGICEAPSFESAGGHFNPTNKQHGFDHPEGPHAGDLENIEVDEDGIVKVTVKNDRVTLQEGKTNSLKNKAGTSLVIHADPDDYVSQPAGDSGDRIVCGVIFAPEDTEEKEE